MTPQGGGRLRGGATLGGTGGNYRAGVAWATSRVGPALGSVAAEAQK